MNAHDILTTIERHGFHGMTAPYISSAAWVHQCDCGFSFPERPGLYPTWSVKDAHVAVAIADAYADEQAERERAQRV